MTLLVQPLNSEHVLVTADAPISPQDIAALVRKHRPRYVQKLSDRVLLLGQEEGQVVIVKGEGGSLYG